MNPTRPKPLSGDQVSFYLREGYLVVDDLLDAATLQPIRRDLSRHVDAVARRLHEEGRLTNLCEDEPFETRLARLYRAALDDDARKALWEAVEGKYYRVDCEGVFLMMTHPVVLDVVEQIVGPEILFHPQSNLRAKLPDHAEGLVPWHRDAVGLSPDSVPTMMVNFWIPLVGVTMDMGGMQVLNGRHHEAMLSPSTKFNISEEDLPEGEIIDCPLPAGGVLLIQKRTIHRSLPNSSDRVRWSLDFRYCDARKRAGRPGGVLVRSRDNPDRVVGSYEEYVAGNMSGQAYETELAWLAAEKNR